jgi:hypothetical protein
MEGVSSLQEIIRPDDCFTNIDLKNAYLTMPLHREDRNFIQIRWGGGATFLIQNASFRSGIRPPFIY